MGGRVKAAASHFKRYLLPYSILAIIAGVAVGYAYGSFFKANRSLISDAIIVLAILTIYPSMIQLKMERLGIAARKVREIVLSMILVFAVSPLLAMGFSTLLPSQDVALGYVVSNVVPASSASIGYVLLAGGDIELATVLAVLSLAGSIVAIPAYLGAYASAVSVSLPMGKVMKALLYTLITPFILGQLTRHLLIGRKARGLAHREALLAVAGLREDGGSPDGGVLERYESLVREFRARFVEDLERSVKPHLSLITMISMLLLIALLGASRARLIVGRPYTTFEIIGMQAVMLAILLGVVTGVDRLIGVSYEENEAIAFISATKNQSLAAAIAVMALGPGAAVVPALIPAVQAPVAIAYLHASPRLRKIFPTR